MKAYYSNPWFKLSYLLLWFSLLHHFCLGANRISFNQSISGVQTIVSSPIGNFELGFFNIPKNSTRYYLGIWYTFAKDIIVWVANREVPMPDNHSYSLKIIHGNLILTNALNTSTIWSTKLNNSTASKSIEAVLLDSGNLVLKNATTTLWQSFDHPTDTLLPGAKIGYNKKTNQSQVITSWKNKNDPAPGLYSVQIDPKAKQLVFLWNNTQQYWTSAPWNPQVKGSKLIPKLTVGDVYINKFVENEDEIYYSFIVVKTAFLVRDVMDASGIASQFIYNPPQWMNTWSSFQHQCGVYAFCGAYGICNKKEPLCNCLEGFVPKSNKDWLLDDYSSGCVRKTQLNCHRDRFSALTNVVLPHNAQTLTVATIEECKSHCLSNCSCNAYSYDNSGCSFWSEDLLNMQQLSDGETSGKTLYLRLPGSEATKKSHKKLIILSVVGSIIFILILLVLCSALIWNKKTQLNDPTMSVKGLLISLGAGIFAFKRESKKAINDANDIETVESLTFELTTIRKATDNFSAANKLGEGGFGEVYKGKLDNGQVVAIKRLSKNSKQGSDEFKTEVVLAAKLHHRNLVKLLGFCLIGREKILVYEFLPNKSLDQFLSDPYKRASLNWETRFKIIGGIAKGLLYLHEDSRLKIVHRDLKPSNILLDEVMNPKISDFGMAKLFGLDQTQDNTNRIVGTYGYMAPEYIVTGNFSVRSDVYGFGIIVLELISGLKSKYLSQHQNDDESLLYRAWRLWNEGKPLELIDPSLGINFPVEEMIKCFQIGLLCVQEDANKRPRIALIVSALNGESVTLTSPTPPRFFTVHGNNGMIVGNSKQCASGSGGILESTIDFGPR